jgi:hypothetical protein
MAYKINKLDKQPQIMSVYFYMKRLLIIFAWLPATLLTLTTTLFFYLYYSNNLALQNRLKQIAQRPKAYQMYVALPKTLGAATSTAKTEDGIPELVSQYLTKYHSPMADSAFEFTRIFRAYNINPIIPLAIAQCESNLGFKIPTEDCKNPFGLGIHSQGTLCFDTWEESYEKMAKVLKEKYIDDGLTSPEEIMKRYCPNSLDNGGSWAKCVTQFIDEIQTMTIRRR